MTPTKKTVLSLLYLFCALLFALLVQSSGVVPVRALPESVAQVNIPSPAFQFISQPVPNLSLLPLTSLEKTTEQVNRQADLTLLEKLEDFSALQDLLAGFDASRPADAQGLYAPGIFALPIVQQPQGKPVYVSIKPGEVTHFQLPERFGVIGMLAHNYLSGGDFYKLDIGQEVWLLFGSRYIKRYRVSSIERYQKLIPTSTDSDYVDLSTGNILTTAQLFARSYKGKHHLTLQTCLEKDGQLNWGLFFVLAVPLRG